MSTVDKYLEELEKMKSKPGFTQKDLSISTSSGQLQMSLHGPKIFHTKMPLLIESVAKAAYNAKMFSAIARAKKPLSVIYTHDRSILGGGRLYHPLPWYCLLCVKEVSQLMLLFNTLGYNEKIPFECRQGNKVIQKQEYDDVKFTLTHEFYHLWDFVEPKSAPKLGKLVRSMYSPPKLQAECWATHYTNGWRYQEKRCVRYIYRFQGINHNVDSVRNYE
jgi:hypothetical protein